MLFAEAAPQVIQVEWQALAVFGSTLGGAIVAAAKLVANQLRANSEAQVRANDKRHEENRSDAIEARKENRDLSGAILGIQSQTVRTLSEMQAEIRAVLAHLGAPGSAERAHPNPNEPFHKKR